jgi:hypothetical protein
LLRFAANPVTYNDGRTENNDRCIRLIDVQEKKR